MKSWLFIFLLFQLGFGGLAWGRTEMIFPRFSYDAGTFTGIAIANLGDASAKVTLTAYGPDGSLLEGNGFDNPVQQEILANQQLARLITEIFGASLAPEQVGWVHAESSSDNLAGFFLFLDGSLSRFDGADLPVASAEVIFNFVRIGDDNSTEINLVNPSQNSTEVSLELVGESGLTETRNLQLAGRGVARFQVADFFEVEGPFQGYLKASASSGRVAGFEFVQVEGGDLLGLNAKPTSEGLEQLYFPQLVVLGPWRSELGLVNYGDPPVILTISARDPNGLLYGNEVLLQNPVTRALEGGQSAVFDVEELFGFEGDETLDGWLEVESTAPTVNGFISYGIPSLGSVAGIATSPSSNKRSLFSHLATSGGFFTGVAALNTSSLAANIRIVALDTEAQSIGQFDTVLKPGQRISRLITELVPGSEDRGGGMIWIESDLELYTSALFGSTRVLANIPPQSPPAAFEPAGLSTIEITPPLGVVQPGGTLQFQVTGAQGPIQWTVEEVSGAGPLSGEISESGLYQAPGDIPSPSIVTVVAESKELRGGATIDVLEPSSLISGLGVLQSVVYLDSLQQIFEVELLGLSGFSQSRTSALPSQGDGISSELFQVEPPNVQTFLESFDHRVEKMIAYPAVNGVEYILLLLRDTGEILRLHPQTLEVRLVFDGLEDPRSLVLDEATGNVLVAEASRVTEVTRNFIEVGLSAILESHPLLPPDPSEVIAAPAENATGLAVDRCSGDIYFSVAEEDALKVFDRSTEEIRTVDVRDENGEGLHGPTQMVAVYRSGQPCPDRFQLLIVEPDNDRIALVVPSRGLIVSWISAPGVRDITLLPEGNPFNGALSIAYGFFDEIVGQVDIIEVVDQYGGSPPSSGGNGSFCVGEVSFDDVALEEAVREALVLDAEDDLLCEEALALTSLDASGREIESLGGIEFLINLQTLDVSHNLLKSLTPALALTELGTLDASHNLITSVELLENLSLIQNLNLSHNLLTSLGSLSSVDSRSSRIRTQEFVPAQLGSLTTLNLAFNSLTDLSPLASLTGLQSLDLTGNFPLTDISPLAPLSQLTSLSLGQCSLFDITAIQNLLNLSFLDLSDNSISDITPLLQNPGLGEGDVIDLSGNPLSTENCEDLLILINRGVELTLDFACDIDLALSMTASPTSAIPGENIDLELSVENRTAQEAEEVQVSIQLPSGSSFFFATPESGSCSHSEGVVLCEVGTLPGLASLGIDVRFQFGRGSGGARTVQASVNSEDQQDAHPEDNQTAVTVNLTTVDLTVTKSASSSSVRPGEELTYTLLVRNEGSARARNVILTDDLPSGFELLDLDFESERVDCTVAGTTLRCSKELLEPSALLQVRVRGHVTLPQGPLTNTARATSRDFDEKGENNSATVETEILQIDLAVTKTAPEPATTGQPLTYVVTVQNLSPQKATDVSVTDSLPADTTFLPGSSSASCAESAPGVVTCTVAEIAANSSASFDITVDVEATGTSLNNSVSVAGNEFDPDTSNNNHTEITALQQIADLQIAKTASPTVFEPGGQIAYTLQVTNNGPSPAANVVVTDTRGSNASYVVESLGGSCSLINEDTEVECDLGTLESGAVEMITLSVQTNDLSDVTNTAAVSSETSDSDMSNNSASRTTPPERADLSVSKASDVDPAVTGSQLEYTVQVTNLGPQDADNATVTDTLPAGVSYRSDLSSTNCSEISPGTVTCDLGTIAVNATSSATIAVDVNTTAASITNTASVSATQPDPDVTNNDDTLELRVEQQSDLTISKVASPSPYLPGGEILYTINVTNNGPSTAQNVQVTDTLPAQVTFLSLSPEGSCDHSGGVVTCDLGSGQPGQLEMLAGESAEITITVEAPSGDPLPILSNVATVTTDTTDPNIANDSITLDTDPQQADLAVSKSIHPDFDPPVAGNSLRYQVTVTNNGPQTATNLVVLDTLPANADFDSESSTSSCFRPDAESFPREVQCDIDSLPSGNSTTLDIYVFVSSFQTVDLINNVSVSADQFDPDSTNNSATLQSAVTREADLTVTKTGPASYFFGGETIEYTITVENRGPSSATGVSVTDDLDPNVTFVSVSSLGASCQQNSVSQVGCSIVSLGRFGSVDIALTVTAPSQNLVDLTNNVSVQGSEFDPDTSNNSDAWQTSIITINARRPGEEPGPQE